MRDDALDGFNARSGSEFYAFDILVSDGEDLRKLPLSMRKINLARLLARRVDGIFLSDFEQGEIGPDLFRHACLMGLEGMAASGSLVPSLTIPTDGSGCNQHAEDTGDPDPPRIERQGGCGYVKQMVGHCSAFRWPYLLSRPDRQRRHAQHHHGADLPSTARASIAATVGSRSRTGSIQRSPACGISSNGSSAALYGSLDVRRSERWANG
jgi:hypothetical protein